MSRNKVTQAQSGTNTKTGPCCGVMILANLKSIIPVKKKKKTIYIFCDISKLGAFGKWVRIYKINLID